MEDGDDQVLHRLCPAYAQDVNSPLRHVRTRIYYTSESHMHSLLNVLRFCHLGGALSHLFHTLVYFITRTCMLSDACLSLYHDSQLLKPVSLYHDSQPLKHYSCFTTGASGGSAPLTPEGSLTGLPLPPSSPNGTAPPTPSKSLEASMEGLGLEEGALGEGVPVPMSGPLPGLLSHDAQGMLDKTTELDYQTQIVFRMFENKRYARLAEHHQALLHST